MASTFVSDVPSKRKQISMEVKCDILKRAEKGESHKKIAESLGIKRSTVTSIVSNVKLAIQYSKLPNSTASLRLRKELINEMEKLLVLWLGFQHQLLLPVTFLSIQHEAQRVFDALREKYRHSNDIERFVPDRVWFEDFKTRHNYPSSMGAELVMGKETSSNMDSSQARSSNGFSELDKEQPLTHAIPTFKMDDIPIKTECIDLDIVKEEPEEATPDPLSMDVSEVEQVKGISRNESKREKRFECSNCLKKFSTRFGLRKHAEHHCLLRFYTGEHSEERFAKTSRMEEHLPTEVVERSRIEDRLAADVVDQFLEKSRAEESIPARPVEHFVERSHFEEGLPVLPVEKLVKKSRIEERRTSRRVEPKYSCPECPYTCSDDNDFAQHMHIHVKEESPQDELRITSISDEESSHQESRSTDTAPSLEELNDKQLISLPVISLNQMLKTLPKEAQEKLKRRRRTLKNRGYARNCRSKRVSCFQQLQSINNNLLEENDKLQEERRHLVRLNLTLVREMNDLRREVENLREGKQPTSPETK